MRLDMCHHGKRTRSLALMVMKWGMILEAEAIRAGAQQALPVVVMQRGCHAKCNDTVSLDCRDTILSTFLSAANAFGYSGALVWQVRQRLKLL